MSARERGPDFAAAPIQQQGLGLSLAAGLDARVSDGMDGRQRLAAKAHGADGLEFGKAGDLAGRVALQGPRQVVRRDAAAVVRDGEADTSTLEAPAAWAATCCVSASGR